MLILIGLRYACLLQWLEMRYNDVGRYKGWSERNYGGNCEKFDCLHPSLSACSRRRP